MKKIVLLFGGFLLAAGAFAQDASPALQASRDPGAIVKRSQDLMQAGTVSSRSRLVVTAKDGAVSERMMDQYSKDGPDGTKTVIIFLRPANVANTRFLTIENSSGRDDQWIYLPSLGKVRRISASEGGSSFMGTDFSYDDISAANRDVNKDNHRLVREESYQGKACYVIESEPKDSTFQYSKFVRWIDKENSVNYKIELYDRRGTHVKTIESLDVKEIQGRLTPMQTKVSTVAAGTSTSIFFDIIRYDDPIPDGVFTPNYLSTGRY